MDVDRSAAGAAARIAAAIGEPARARMLYGLMDGHARTSTELALIANVTPSTASVHLARLRDEHLVEMMIQGRHRYYTLAGSDVAGVLEALSIASGLPAKEFVPSTPTDLRAARTCYDHIAGTLGVALHDRFLARGWILARPARPNTVYQLTSAGELALSELGVDVDALRAARRRFAFACLDWSERRPHIGGALGAAILKVALERKWVTGERRGRALAITRLGRRELHSRFGLEL